MPDDQEPRWWWGPGRRRAWALAQAEETDRQRRNREALRAGLGVPPRPSETADPRRSVDPGSDMTWLHMMMLQQNLQQTATPATRCDVANTNHPFGSSPSDGAAGSGGGSGGSSSSSSDSSSSSSSDSSSSSSSDGGSSGC